MFKKKRLQEYDYFNVVSYSDIDANERLKEKLDFLGISSIRKRTLEQLKELYVKNSDYVIDNFYKRLHTFPYLDKMIKENTKDEFLKKAFHYYMLSLFEDELNIKYVFKRRAIAEAHARIGLTPDWIIEAFSLIKQLFIPIIAKSLIRRPTDLLDAILAYDSLMTLDQTIICETYMELQANALVDGLSEIISYNVEIDEIRDLLRYQEEQKEASMSVSSAMEQLSASVEEVANSVTQLTESSNDSLEKLDDGIEKIKTLVVSMNDIDKEQATISEYMEHLTIRVDNMEKVTAFIHEIAEQTNLLALNASIEAARAGESGRGFSIVADEVRKLADHSRQSINTISEEMTELISITEKVNKLIDQSSKKLHSGVAYANELSENLSLINESTQEIGRHFEEIAGISQQQAATTQDITERNNSINESLEKGADIGFRTGKAVYQLSKMINRYRLRAISKNMKVSQEDIVQLAITDHLLWRWKIYNMILGYDTLKPEDVSSPEDCRLGRWYHGPGKKFFSNNPYYIRLDEPHKRVHDLAREATIAIRNGNRERANEILEEIAQTSKEVAELLYKIKESIIEGKKSYRASVIK